MKFITKTVWVLSLVSLLTDTASEMLYPVMPLYLKTIGFSVLLIGILEGMAEATAGLSKGYFGQRSDLSGRRAPFVQMGYAFSAISKPLMAIFTYPGWVFFARSTDRLGKGIRTGARDAMLSDEATPETKGRVFGFHRAMDTVGAVLGPALALVYLHYYPENYKTLFFIAFAPGLIAVAATFVLQDKPVATKGDSASVSFFSFLSYWKTSPPAYRKLVVGLLVFALFNSSDAFLLLRAKQLGLEDSWVIGVYIFYNLVYALTAFPMGALADKIGLKFVFLLGLGMFSLVYFGMTIAENPFGSANPILLLILFILYGVYAASTEGISKAWISNISDKKDTATAIGTFAGLQSVITLFASTLTGFIWFQFGASAAFLTTATATVVTIIYFLGVPFTRDHAGNAR
ncbi:MAG: MFS transporter [Cyclobacteriaceae bacterium]|nr:MFS transporter [Cyclobacteriaceae bacterium]